MFPELAEEPAGKSSEALRFPIDQPLPPELVEKLIAVQLQQAFPQIRGDSMGVRTRPWFRSRRLGSRPRRKSRQGPIHSEAWVELAVEVGGLNRPRSLPAREYCSGSPGSRALTIRQSSPVRNLQCHSFLLDGGPGRRLTPAAQTLVTG